MLHAGRKYKKSIEKDKSTLEFVPTNLHIQQMKVTDGEKEGIYILFFIYIFNEILNLYIVQQLAYEVVTVDCPTAYSLKYRPGGFIKWQTTVPFCYAK